MKIDIKTINVATFALIIAFSANASTQQNKTYTIEDKDLSPVQNNISSAIASDSSYQTFKALNCKLEGEKIQLSPLKTDSYLVTTADACGWGASLGPIWIVTQANENYSVALNAGGYSVRASKSINHGLYDLEIADSTAGGTHSKTYKFDGQRYK